MDPDWIQRMIVGITNQFGWLVCCSFDNSTNRHVERIIAHMGVPLVENPGFTTSVYD
jgi:hypothetical protein